MTGPWYPDFEGMNTEWLSLWAKPDIMLPNINSLDVLKRSTSNRSAWHPTGRASAMSETDIYLGGSGTVMAQISPRTTTTSKLAGPWRPSVVGQGFSPRLPREAEPSFLGSQRHGGGNSSTGSPRESVPDSEVHERPPVAKQHDGTEHPPSLMPSITGRKEHDVSAWRPAGRKKPEVETSLAASQGPVVASMPDRPANVWRPGGTGQMRRGAKLMVGGLISASDLTGMAQESHPAVWRPGGTGGGSTHALHPKGGAYTVKSIDTSHASAGSTLKPSQAVPRRSTWSDPSPTPSHPRNSPSLFHSRPSSPQPGDESISAPTTIREHAYASLWQSEADGMDSGYRAWSGERGERGQTARNGLAATSSHCDEARMQVLKSQFPGAHSLSPRTLGPEPSSPEKLAWSAAPMTGLIDTITVHQLARPPAAQRLGPPAHVFPAIRRDQAALRAQGPSNMQASPELTWQTIQASQAQLGVADGWQPEALQQDPACSQSQDLPQILIFPDADALEVLHPDTDMSGGSLFYGDTRDSPLPNAGPKSPTYTIPCHVSAGMSEVGMPHTSAGSVLLAPVSSNDALLAAHVLQELPAPPAARVRPKSLPPPLLERQIHSPDARSPLRTKIWPFIIPESNLEETAALQAHEPLVAAGRHLDARQDVGLAMATGSGALLDRKHRQSHAQPQTAPAALWGWTSPPLTTDFVAQTRQMPLGHPSWLPSVLEVTQIWPQGLRATSSPLPSSPVPEAHTAGSTALSGPLLSRTSPQSLPHIASKINQHMLAVSSNNPSTVHSAPAQDLTPFQSATRGTPRLPTPAEPGVVLAGIRSGMSKVQRQPAHVDEVTGRWVNSPKVARLLAGVPALEARGMPWHADALQPQAEPAPDNRATAISVPAQMIWPSRTEAQPALALSISGHTPIGRPHVVVQQAARPSTQASLGAMLTGLQGNRAAAAPVHNHAHNERDQQELPGNPKEQAMAHDDELVSSLKDRDQAEASVSRPEPPANEALATQTAHIKVAPWKAMMAGTATTATASPLRGIDAKQEYHPGLPSSYSMEAHILASQGMSSSINEPFSFPSTTTSYQARSFPSMELSALVGTTMPVPTHAGHGLGRALVRGAGVQSAASNADSSQPSPQADHVHRGPQQLFQIHADGGAEGADLASILKAHSEHGVMAESNAKGRAGTVSHGRGLALSSEATYPTTPIPHALPARRGGSPGAASDGIFHRAQAWPATDAPLQTGSPVQHTLLQAPAGPVTTAAPIHHERPHTQPGGGSHIPLQTFLAHTSVSADAQVHAGMPKSMSMPTSHSKLHPQPGLPLPTVVHALTAATIGIARLAGRAKIV